MDSLKEAPMPVPAKVRPQTINERMRRTSVRLAHLLAAALICLPFKLLPNSDSLIAIIRNAQGPNRVYARLDYADAIARTEYNGAIRNAKLALAESYELGSPLLTVEAQFRLAQLFMGNNHNDSAEIYLNQALPVAKAQGDHNFGSRIQLELGKISQYRGNDIRAVELFTGAIEAAEQIDDYRIIGACYSLIGNIYRLLGAYDEALESIIRAKSNYELADFEEGAAWIAYSLGRLYQGIGIYEEADTSFNESLKIYTKLAAINGDSTGIALCLDQLGLLHIAHAMPQLAQPLFRRSLAIYTQSNSLYGIANAWKFLGKTEFALGNYTEAETLLHRSLAYKYQSKDALGIPGTYETLGLVLIAENNWQAGIDTLMIGMEMAKANNQHQILHDIYGDLASAYEKRGDYQEATRFYKLQFGLQSFVGSTAVRFKLPELRGIYEMEQTRKQIRSLQQSNQIIELQLAQQRIIQWSLILGGIVLVIFLGLVTKQYRRIQATNTENELLIKNLQSEIYHRELTEKELAQSDSLRELLLDIITHDLKNPAGVIYAFAELARQRSPENEIIENIYLSSERLLNVLNNTTLLSQATFGESIPMEQLNLLQMMTTIVHEFSSHLRNAEMHLDMHIPADILITANSLIAEVLKNYISNAIKYAAVGKEIIIEAAHADNTVLIKVKDFGPTIPKEQREYIFERHAQLAEGEKRGRGLGLAIVKRIAQAHNGDVWVEPNLPTGNQFCLRLPDHQVS